MTNVFKRWELAKISEKSPEDIDAMRYTSDFYDLNGYFWDGMPVPVDGEVGYDDRSGCRIKAR